ncbi:hypothetical protein RHMOL_Rhmol11G0228700 [Rhododendron molle]|uniref:Uncharacterized protein n=1 Tax=Rhododendron molle TaxID=49168 RepID=A0ACC0LWE1_RHOML|nr:hypothetical protein RHMOL_Rhmol11G0228700 [Rhododendron molle]
MCPNPIRTTPHPQCLTLRSTPPPIRPLRHSRRRPMKQPSTTSSTRNTATRPDPTSSARSTSPLAKTPSTGSSRYMQKANGGLSNYWQWRVCHWRRNGGALRSTAPRPPNLRTQVRVRVPNGSANGALGHGQSQLEPNGALGHGQSELEAPVRNAFRLHRQNLSKNLRLS